MPGRPPIIRVIRVIGIRMITIITSSAINIRWAMVSIDIVCTHRCVAVVIIYILAIVDIDINIIADVVIISIVVVIVAVIIIIVPVE